MIMQFFIPHEHLSLLNFFCKWPKQNVGIFKKLKKGKISSVFLQKSAGD